MKTNPEDNSIVLAPSEAREMSNALADVLCWFSGFKAAKPNTTLPPGLDELRTLNIQLKNLNWENHK